MMTRGISLLELLLVMVLMAVLLFIAIHRYQIYAQQKDIVAVQQNVAMLMHATQLYYRECCSKSNGTNTKNRSCMVAAKPPVFDVSIIALERAGLISPGTLQETKLVDRNGYAVQAISKGQDQNGNPLYQLQVSANLNIKLAALSWYQQILQATSATPNVLQLHWTYLPGYEIRDRQSGLWAFDASLREFKNQVLIAGGTDDSCAY